MNGHMAIVKHSSFLPAKNELNEVISPDTLRLSILSLTAIMFLKRLSYLSNSVGFNVSVDISVLAFLVFFHKLEVI